MRRRQREETPAPGPERVLRFDPSEWGPDEHAACRWYEARDEWRALHPGEDLPLPDDAPDTVLHLERI